MAGRGESAQRDRIGHPTTDTQRNAPSLDDSSPHANGAFLDEHEVDAESAQCLFTRAVVFEQLVKAQEIRTCVGVEEGQVEKVEIAEALLDECAQCGCRPEPEDQGAW